MYLVCKPGFVRSRGVAHASMCQPSPVVGYARWLCSVFIAYSVMMRNCTYPYGCTEKTECFWQANVHGANVLGRFINMVPPIVQPDWC